jgi:hypothetical protein
MSFKPAQCPNCGGSLQLPDDRTTVNCMYCGVSIVVHEAIQAAAVATVPNLLRLAQTALASSNSQEAYEYFTRVLEIDVNNTHAWAGKAEAAGKLSSQQTFRMPEMLNYFGNAIASATNSQMDHVRNKAAEVICAVVSEEYMKMRSGLSPAFFDNATWAFYLNRVSDLLRVLEDATRLIPTDSRILQTILWLCDQNTNRVNFRNALGKPVQRQFDPSWSASIARKRETFLEELYRLNPALRPAQRMPTKKTGFSIDRKLVFVGVGIVVLSFALILAAIVTLSTANPSADGRNPTNLSPTPTASTTTSKSEHNSTSSKFDTTAVCSLPAQLTSNTAFARLGGGRWQKWTDAGGELGYACEGGADQIKLKNDGSLDITAEYSVLGNAQSAHYISAEYTAFRYAGPSEVENTFRQQYADFCDRLASKVYGAKISEKFRDRLLNEFTYSKAGSANSYYEKIGIGVIAVSSNKNDRMIMVNVRFFPTESDFKSYKDS